MSLHSPVVPWIHLLNGGTEKWNWGREQQSQWVTESLSFEGSGMVGEGTEKEDTSEKVHPKISANASLASCPNLKPHKYRVRLQDTWQRTVVGKEHVKQRFQRSYNAGETWEFHLSQCWDTLVKILDIQYRLQKGHA